MLNELLIHLQYSVILIGFFLSFFFFIGTGSKSNKWLGLLTLIISIHFINLILVNEFPIPHLGLVFGFFYGPIILGYVQSHFKSSTRNKFIHFLPGFVLLAWILIIDLDRGITPASELYITSGIVFAHLLIYLRQSHQSYKKYRQVLENTRSSSDDNKIDFIRYIIIGIIILFAFSLLHTITGILIISKLEISMSILISAFLLFGMFSIIYVVMNSSRVFSPFTLEEEQLVIKDNQYASSGLTQENALKYRERLIGHLHKNKSFCDPDLSINLLAKQTHIPVRYLSQVINQNMNQNFFDLINGYRIREAQNQLRNSEKRISEIMYEVGFSSRSSFNNAFKKYSGLTPSQYRKEL